MAAEGLIKLSPILVIPIVQGAVAFFANFFVHLELHTTLDKIIGMRGRTSHAITSKLMKMCNNYHCEYAPRISNNQKAAMRQFYLLEATITYDRSLLYDRWLRYYLDLYIVGFSVVTVAVCLVLRFVYFTHFNVLIVAAFAFTVITTLALLDATLRLPSRLLDLAESSPLRLLDKDEAGVLRGMLAVCGAPEWECPWKRGSGRKPEMTAKSRLTWSQPGDSKTLIIWPECGDRTRRACHLSKGRHR